MSIFFNIKEDIVKLVLSPGKTPPGKLVKFGSVLFSTIVNKSLESVNISSTAPYSQDPFTSPWLIPRIL